jgi:hypothetical protein
MEYYHGDLEAVARVEQAALDEPPEAGATGSG